MKSKEEIEIEFSKAYEKAQLIEDIAGTLIGLANTINMTDLAAFEKAWKGENAMLLSMKGRDVSTDIFATAQDLIRVANSIKSSAELIYKAEKAAILLAYH